MRGANKKPSLHLIEHLNAADLRILWKDHNGMLPPPTLSAWLMRHALAWNLQGKASKLDPKLEQKAWSKLMSLRARRQRLGPADLPQTKAPAGTRLLKDWGGVTHEVVIGDNAMVWNDQSYNSLSAIATAMTGTKRNGPRFFGLRG